MSNALTDDDRKALAAIADVLIPEREGMPSASQVGVHDAAIDRVLDLRRDLLQLLLRGLHAPAGDTAKQTVEALDSNDPAALKAIGEAAKAAYYMEPRVRALLGYPGQQSRPATADEEGDYLRDGMLQAVMDRGPIYRRCSPDKKGDHPLESSES
ncbi:MAG: gluconate 2-dehydrogenase subunit 3 family protein [Hyphomicrobiales bacterium]|nr:gluconate 2-dehydrogenase subunit 3 family protein [Hyphomicrobiales bacterium]